MATICRTLGNFTKEFPETLVEFIGRNEGKASIGAAGITVLAGKAFQISSIIGGSAAVGSGILTLLAVLQLGDSYEALGGKSKCVNNTLEISTIVAPIFSGGMVATLIGHPISLLGRIALTGIFFVSTAAIKKIGERTITPTRVGT